MTNPGECLCEETGEGRGTKQSVATFLNGRNVEIASAAYGGLAKTVERLFQQALSQK